MEGILEEEKDFKISILCFRRSENEEQFMNCKNLFHFYLEEVTRDEFIKSVRSKKPTDPSKT
jgi:hypothetical protein